MTDSDVKFVYLFEFLKYSHCPKLWFFLMRAPLILGGCFQYFFFKYSCHFFQFILKKYFYIITFIKIFYKNIFR